MTSLNIPEQTLGISYLLLHSVDKIHSTYTHMYVCKYCQFRPAQRYRIWGSKSHMVNLITIIYEIYIRLKICKEYNIRSSGPFGLVEFRLAEEKSPCLTFYFVQSFKCTFLGSWNIYVIPTRLWHLNILKDKKLRRANSTANQYIRALLSI